jgi:hypothetical protein
MTRVHTETQVKLPERVRPTHAGIDERLVPLITRLWQLGYVTLYCCQGGDTVPAYIAFRTCVEAALFLALAGPAAWTPKERRRRRAEPGVAGGASGECDWEMEAGNGIHVVRFPARDIPLATTHLVREGVRLEALIGALSETPLPRLSAPPECPRCRTELIGALIPSPDAHHSAPRTCPTCGGVVPSRRRDARYCSRRCQLAARDRRGGCARRCDE